MEEERERKNALLALSTASRLSGLWQSIFPTEVGEVRVYLLTALPESHRVMG